MSASDRTEIDVSGIQKPLGIVLLSLVALLAIVRVAFWLSCTLLPDEAYYWMWGQHPALSFYDHPPLNAWLLWLSSKAFGWNLLAIRFWPVITLLVDLWLLWLLSKQLSKTPRSHFAVAAILFAATPIFITMSALALPDHLLITFLLASLLFFVRFFDRIEQLNWADLAIACTMLGFATLAKYNAVLLGAAAFLFAVLDPKIRSIFGRWQSYAAFGLFLLVVSPELIWNITTQASSIAFILEDRHAGLPTDNDFGGLTNFLSSVIAFLSPLLLWPLLRVALSFTTNVRSQRFAQIAFWVSSFLFLGLSLTTEIMFHWNLVAYVAVLPFLPFVVRLGWLLAAHALYGLVLTTFVAYNFSVLPLRTYFSSSDYFSARAYGWSEIADVVGELSEEHNVGFIAGIHYSVAAPLGFALKDSSVTALGGPRSQYQFWFDAQNKINQNGLVVTSKGDGIPAALSSRFSSLELLETIVISRQGYTVEQREIYLGVGFKG